MFYHFSYCLNRYNDVSGLRLAIMKHSKDKLLKLFLCIHNCFLSIEHYFEKQDPIAVQSATQIMIFLVFLNV